MEGATLLPTLSWFDTCNLVASVFGATVLALLRTAKGVRQERGAWLNEVFAISTLLIIPLLLLSLLPVKLPWVEEAVKGQAVLVAVMLVYTSVLTVKAVYGSFHLAVFGAGLGGEKGPPRAASVPSNRAEGSSPCLPGRR